MPRPRFIFTLSDEMDNSGNVHRALVKKIEAITKRTLIVYIGNFAHPAGAIMDQDADLIENIIKSVKIKDKLDFYIDSPGGLPFAATKIVKVLKCHCQELRAIVYKRAMSAATLICLGADELLMNETGSLGPIDPQMQTGPINERRLVASNVIMKSFLEMIQGAQNAILAQRPPDPFYVILNQMDVNGVFESIQAMAATEKIATDLLMQGLLKNNHQQIPISVKKFLETGAMELHGKHLFPDVLQKDFCLQVETIPKNSNLEQYLMELSIRGDRFVGQRALAKYIVCDEGAIEMRVQVLRI